MTTFTTTINAMYTVQQPDPDYVVNVLFTVTGVDGANTASIDGSLQFNSDQAPETFIPYDQLTEAVVVGWVDASGQLPNLQACVQGQIDSMITPPVSPENTPLPWSA
jgi:hypothetical protein